jgi:hypothetical protein
MEKINDEIDLLKDIPILRVSSGDYRNEFMEEKVQNKKKEIPHSYCLQPQPCQKLAWRNIYRERGSEAAPGICPYKGKLYLWLPHG